MSVLWFPLLTFGLGGLGQEAKPAPAAACELSWTGAAEGTVRILRRSAMSLDRLEGVRIVAKYRSREGGREVVGDLLEFLRPSRTKRGTLPGYYVSIHLRSPQDTYATDLREFETLLLSVRFSEPQK